LFRCASKIVNLKIKGRIVFDSCTRCREQGEYFQNRTCFPFTQNNLLKRTHNDDVIREHDEHHVGSAISNLSILPNIDIVANFSLDYMHLTCISCDVKIDSFVDR